MDKHFDATAPLYANLLGVDIGGSIHFRSDGTYDFDPPLIYPDQWQWPRVVGVTLTHKREAGSTLPEVEPVNVILYRDGIYEKADSAHDEWREDELDDLKLHADGTWEPIGDGPIIARYPHDIQFVMPAGSVGILRLESEKRYNLRFFKLSRP